ncbi:MAG: hypothetical protein FJX75_05000 [Armatimonadetes bacterium]|nr:hypothetical protein [Armatimonadota bacterium]
MTPKRARKWVPRVETDTVRECEALCEVLNWTEEEAAQAEAEVARCFEERRALRERYGWGLTPFEEALGYVPEAFAGAIPLLRRMARHILDRAGVPLAAGPWPLDAPGVRYIRMLDESERPGRQPAAATRFLPVSAVGIDEREARMLNHLARIGPKWFEVRFVPPRQGYEAIVMVSWKGLPYDGTSRIVWATRALLAVLLGEVQLARCTVKWQRGPRKGQRCGRVYVVQGPAGRTRDFCGSAACKERRKRNPLDD